MNQILLTNDDKNGSSSGMKPIIRFFCVAIIIFAIILICEGGFKLYNSLGKNKDFPKPALISEKNGSSLNIVVNGEIGINKLVYSWNGGDETVVEGNGMKNAKFEIQIPNGDNVLSSYVVDVKGNKTKFEDVPVSFTSSDDTVKPIISLENKDGKLEVSVTDETELDYMTYQWEEAEEVRVEVSEDDKRMIKQTIDVEKGTKRLVISAYDKSGNKQTVSKKIIGSNGPTVTASISNGNFVIKVTDEFGLTKIEYTHNDELFTINDLPQNATEYEFTIPVKDGDNYVKVNAYENGIMTEFKCKKTK